MALRLSRQSSCKGFDEHPLRRHRAFTDPEGPLNIRMTRTYLLFTISYRTGSHPANRQAPANFCFHDVFVSATRISRSNQNLGGAGRDRTDDPLLAKQVLSQLSYGPLRYGRSPPRADAPGQPARGAFPAQKKMVGLGGLEPPTSRLSSARSNQLSYKPASDNRRTQRAGRVAARAGAADKDGDQRRPTGPSRRVPHSPQNHPH